MLDGLFPTDATEAERAPRHAPSVAQPPVPALADTGTGGTTSGPAHGQAGPLVTPRVIGIDLSLTGTGVAATSPEGITTRTITTKKYGPTLEEQWQRLRYIDSEIHRTIDAAPDLALIEGPSYGSTGSGTWDRAGLWWMVVHGLLALDVPVAIVPPSLLKQYATGKGGGKGATKAAVASSAGKRYDRVFATDDEADAFVLCAMGLDHLGHPPVAMPQNHRQALAKVAWPEGTTP